MAATPARPARILIADDHPLARAGLRALLASEPDLLVVGEAADGAEALRLCRALAPDLALLDVRMPPPDGPAAARAIRAACPGVAVLLVTIHADPATLVRAAGTGLVRKDATQPEVVAAIRRTLREAKLPLALAQGHVDHAFAAGFAPATAD